jgi:hypothetical protein
MPAPTIHKAEFFEDSGGSLMARVLAPDATVITSSKITGITYSVYDTAAASTSIVNASTLTVSAVVFDTLQTDARWDRDATGYNFRYDVNSSELPNGKKKYRFEFKFDPVSGADFHVAWEVTTVDLYRS